MKPPVLVIAAAPDARVLRTALEGELALTVTDDLDRARALSSTGGFLIVLASAPFASSLPLAIAVDPLSSGAILSIAHTAIARASEMMHDAARDDHVGAVAYDDYVELTRYATMRRYLFALLTRHGGSVTDAARGANMKRESLHRLMRRYHVVAEDFRTR